jgi:hypothetical protein
MSPASKTFPRDPDCLSTSQRAFQPAVASLPARPGLDRLTHALRSALPTEGMDGHRVKILARKPNIFQSSAHSEILVCRLTEGSQTQVFCKHAVSSSERHPVLKGGVSYEASVYRDVLQPLPVSHAHFYGQYMNPSSGEAWLFIEFLNRTSRLSGTSDADAMELAARWLGNFHRANEPRVSNGSLSFLGRYDYDYYLGWAKRTWSYAGKLRQRCPWLAKLCKGFGEVASALLQPPLTVIHGECTPRNVLIRRRRIYPIDWESAATAAGVIDLASLTWGWPRATVQRCEEEYRRARWPQGAPRDFEWRLNCARLFWLFRWLGDPDPSERSPELFRQLRPIGRQLGLIR